MNRKRDLIQIEEAYSAVAGNPPGKAAAKQQLKPGKAINSTYERAGKEVKTKMPAANPGQYKGFVQDNSGPAGADNFHSVELDPDNPAISDENAYDVKQMSDEGADTYFKAENKKIAKENINNSMAKNKSIFDRLYEEVMDDETFDAVELGIGDDEAGDDIESSDEITITIDKDLALKLHDVLVDVLDGGTDGVDDEADLEPEGDLGDEDEQEYGHNKGDSRLTKADEDEDEEHSKRYGTGKHQYRRKKVDGHETKAGEGPKGHYKDYEGEEDEDEESFNYFGEEIEAEDLGTPLVNQKEGNPTPVTGSANVIKSSHTSSVGKKGGDGKVTDKVGDDGDEGTPLVNQKKGNAMSVKGSSNVVKSKYTSKSGGEYFTKNG
tara:strand:+ start:572 stop:1708 length:1137 start_codon:yes stop_codon:yes gene_type:complete